MYNLSIIYPNVDKISSYIPERKIKTPN